MIQKQTSTPDEVSSSRLVRTPVDGRQGWAEAATQRQNDRDEIERLRHENAVMKMTPVLKWELQHMTAAGWEGDDILMPRSIAEAVLEQKRASQPDTQWRLERIVIW